MKTIIFFLALIPIMLNAQVDETVSVDTSNSVKQLNRFEISKNANTYTFKQFKDQTIFEAEEVTGKNQALRKLTQILQQLNQDEAQVVKQLFIIRERKKEIKNARDLYK